jgi:hypothetical protein
MSSVAAAAPRTDSAIATIALAGGAAGAVDFFYATARTIAAGGSALTPWKGVAAALLGVKAVMNGGDAIAIVGVGLHFLITIVAASIYYAVARRMTFLARHAVASGAIFGILFLLAMNYVILPLSVMGKPLYVGAQTLAYAALSHILLIGLPIALIIAWRLRSSVGRMS